MLHQSNKYLQTVSLRCAFGSAPYSFDLEAVKALLINQDEMYTATLNSRTSEIERLVLLVEKLQRMLFGTKSDKVLRQIE